MLEAGREYNGEWAENRPTHVTASAPELFYQVKVAQRIRNLWFSPAVFLEYSGKHAWEYNAEQAGREQQPPGGLEGRIDIVIAGKKKREIFQPFEIAIETKRFVRRWETVQEDVERLSELVWSGGFQMGLCLFLTGYIVGRRNKRAFDQYWQELEEDMERYKTNNTDLDLLLVPLKRGGERLVKKDNGEIESRAWFVSGVDIRLSK